MGRFRRRRPTVAWLPHLQNDPDNSVVSFYSGNINVGAGFNILTTSIFSLVPDYPAAAIRAVGETPSLADFEASSYRLRRVVGKIHLAYSNEQPIAGTTPLAAVVCAGFIVLRVDEQTGAPLNATPNEYSPLLNDNMTDPWIWRRSWILQNDFAGVDSNTQLSWQFPRSNYEYGSVQDGPHIDQKTARRVAEEERLFFVLSTQNISGTADAGGFVRYLLDYRIVASPMRAVGNRRNASR